MPNRIGKYVLLFNCYAICAGGAQGQTTSNLANEYYRDLGARSSLARGETVRAVDTLQATSKANPFDPVALNNLAVTQAAQGDYLNAVASLERAYRLAPTRSDIASNLRNLQIWIGQSHTSTNINRPISPLIFPRAEDAPPDLPALWESTNTPPSVQRVTTPSLITSQAHTANPPPTQIPAPGNSGASIQPEIIVLTPSMTTRTKRK
jgi:tetratricopeptide (TPR) repeat protein